MANEKLVNRENLKNVRQAFQDKLEKGLIVPSKSLQAKSIQAVSTESGTIQETPFIAQGTGTANNTSPVDTAPVGKQLEKQGNTFCVNQLLQNGNFASTSNWAADNGTFSVSNNIATFTATAQNGSLYQLFNFVIGKKYLFVGEITLTTATTDVKVIVRGDTFVSTTATTNKQYIYKIYNCNSTSSNSIQIRDTRASGWDEIQVKNIQFIDLTKWFNGDIPQDLLDNPSHWSWYQNYGYYIVYNTGTLVNCAGRYLVDTGRNQFDKSSVSIGNLVQDGTIDTTGTNYRTSDYILVVPNSNYYLSLTGTTRLKFYDKNKQPLNTTQFDGNVNGSSYTILNTLNAFYVRITTLLSNLNSVTFALYYSTGDGYSDYYTYEQPKTYDTGVEVLRKLSDSIKDYKLPNGTITRMVGTRAYASGDESDTDVWTDRTTTYYALTTPTTEQGTPFAENIEINDYGAMYWLDTNNALVEIPQGTKLFYPADYVLYLDSLVKKTNGSVNNLLSKTMTQAQFDSAMNGFGYYKVEDLTNEMTTTLTFTVGIKKAYKIGNIIFLTLQLRNMTGGTITSGTTIFSITNKLYGDVSVVAYADVGGVQSRFVISHVNQNMSLGSNWANNTVMYLNMCYAI